jgi:hypothetical protein
MRNFSRGTGVGSAGSMAVDTRHTPYVFTTLGECALRLCLQRRTRWPSSPTRFRRSPVAPSLDLIIPPISSKNQPPCVFSHLQRRFETVAGSVTRIKWCAWKRTTYTNTNTNTNTRVVVRKPRGRTYTEITCIHAHELPVVLTIAKPGWWPYRRSPMQSKLSAEIETAVAKWSATRGTDMTGRELELARAGYQMTRNSRQVRRIKESAKPDTAKPNQESPQNRRGFSPTKPRGTEDPRTKPTAGLEIGC